jgi:hypothetical protein
MLFAGVVTGKLSQAIQFLLAPVMAVFLLLVALSGQPAAGQVDPRYAEGYSAADENQPQAPVQRLGAARLQQLVAPIALYPDTLVAQVLAAATYPAQVVGADHWVASQGYASPEQIAAGADTQTWDPSVKALTAFPRVLALMDRDLQWTTDLGNAYYNQPQDVLETVQALRQRAQAAGTLQDSPQEAVSYNQGYIQLAPVNSQVVYVPAYNPWEVYGEPVTPYQGFSLLDTLGSIAGSSPVRFGMGIAMSAFSRTPFGWAGWALDWLTQSVLFHQSNYTSNSTSVAHWGLPSNGQGYWPALPRRPAPLDQSRLNPSREGFGRPATEYSRRVFARQSDRNPENYNERRSYENTERPNRGDSDQGFQGYNHFQAPVNMTARQQAETRSGYGSGFFGGSAQNYPSRPAPVYRSPMQNWRGPESESQRGTFAQRSYQDSGQRSGERWGERSHQASAGRGFAEPLVKPAHSGGFHLFGSGHSAEKFNSSGDGRMPKSHGSGKSFSKGHSGGGGHSSGHHSGGHHH